MSGVLIKRGSLETDTEERRPREDRGRDWSNASTSQEPQGLPARGGKKDPPLVAQREAADTSSSDL